MEFVDKPFGTFRNKAYEIFNKENHVELLEKLWKDTYDYLSLMQHELILYNRDVHNYNWPYLSFRDHVFHETNRICGNINSTISNYKWYLKEGMEVKAKSSKEYIIRSWLEWEFYLQTLEYIYITTVKEKK